jgi:hypothetical protein
VKYDPSLLTLSPLGLHIFYKSLNKGSANYLDSITGGVLLHKILAEGREILDNIIEYTTFVVKPKILQEERKSSHEDLLAAESDLSPSTSLDSAIEPLLEPGTSEGEDIRPLKFPSQFEDDPSRYHKNTSISSMPN